MKSIIILGVFLFGAGSIIVALNMFTETRSHLDNLAILTSKLGYESMLAGIFTYLFGFFIDSFRIEDNFEANYKRLIYKIDRFIYKNLVFAIILVIMGLLSVYKIIMF